MNMNESPLTAQVPKDQQSIGSILVDDGTLSQADAERVVQRQKQGGMRFGDAAMELGLVSPEDLRFALAQQFEYPYLKKGAGSKVSEEVIAAYDPFQPVVESLRGLRTQLLRRWNHEESLTKGIAVVSPDHGEGRSWMAANLAVVLSQLGERTLLVDADLRNPRQHKLFGLEAQHGLSSLLADRAGAEVIQMVPGLRSLAVLPAGAVPPNPQELFTRPVLTALLQKLGTVFDAIVIDTSAGADYADALAVAYRVGSAVMVAKRDHSSLDRVKSYANLLQQGGVNIVGSVLNVV